MSSRFNAAEADRRSGERGEPVVDHRSRRQRVVDEEDGDEDRQTAPDLDVQPQQGPEGQEPDRHQRAHHDPDHGAADHGEDRDTQRLLQTVVNHVVRNRIGPVGHQRDSGILRRHSTARTAAESAQTTSR